MNQQAIIETEDHFGSGVYGHQPIVLVRGEGARLWDAAGREYIDCMSGHGVANVGHAHPSVVEAIAAQAARLAVCPNGFYNDVRAELLREICRVAPDGLDRAFLCNSGTEAVEGALKFARVSTGRTKIVAAMRGQGTGITGNGCIQNFESGFQLTGGDLHTRPRHLRYLIGGTFLE